MSNGLRAAAPRIAVVGGTVPALQHAMDAGIRTAFVHRKGQSVPEWAASAANVELHEVDYGDLKALTTLLEGEHERWRPGSGPRPSDGP